ncbi:unnamed protein product [Nippostrongylus brasiliensis]|uniref:LOB domain-containing protein n=1 Tax=Nippostrongylus brasiliensis TaxID=27835 RepID=A0A0N4XYS0_NIPBR|nr:unnamed protein product [Nippostrongylus brasiliensis]
MFSNSLIVGEQFLQLLYNWQWVDIDNTQLPSVMRGGERFLAVHMVQLKLLSKFPPAIPAEIISRFTMVSHKMSTVEAWQFNAINAIKRKFDLGCQLFTTQDEVVRLNDVQMFYWNVKALNLSRIVQQYDAELQNTNGNLTLIATIQSLKNHVEADLERVRKELRALAEQHQPHQGQSAVPGGQSQQQQQPMSNDVITINDHHQHVTNGTMLTSSLTESQHKDINHIHTLNHNLSEHNKTYSSSRMIENRDNGSSSATLNHLSIVGNHLDRGERILARKLAYRLGKACTQTVSMDCRSSGKKKPT